MVNVLIVEDSPVVRELLIHTIEYDPEINIVGTASTGEEAIKLSKLLNPDVITMDIKMPGIGGIEATRRIMEENPTPIIIVSSVIGSSEETQTSFEAMQAGALALFPKPPGYSEEAYIKIAAELTKSIKLMSEVKVIKRQPNRSFQKDALRETHYSKTARERVVKLIVIGSSTGGPVVLQKIFSHLPKNFPIPILIVQHMAAGFIEGFTAWLKHTTGFNVKIPVNEELIKPSTAYIAPDNRHMTINASGKIILINDDPVNGLRPSVSYLFSTAAQFYGANSAAVLLSGMGKDGAAELKILRDKDALTIVQDKESSVVYGMPGEAIKLDAVELVLSPQQIVDTFNSIAKIGTIPTTFGKSLLSFFLVSR
jgi:two-component system chemotaxis response regulator CheB